MTQTLTPVPIKTRTTKKILPAKQRITFDEFLKTYMNGEHVEWVNGEVVPMCALSFDLELSAAAAKTLGRLRERLTELGLEVSYVKEAPSAFFGSL